MAGRTLASRKRPEQPGDWIRCNYGSGASVNTFPLSFAPRDMPGNGSVYKTATGELIPDRGSVRVRGETDTEWPIQLTGRVSGVHKVLVSGAKLAEAGLCSWLDHGGGWLVHKKSKEAKAITQMLEQAAWKEEAPMHQLYEENGVYNFYMRLGAGGSIAAVEMESDAKM